MVVTRSILYWIQVLDEPQKIRMCWNMAKGNAISLEFKTFTQAGHHSYEYEIQGTYKLKRKLKISAS